MRSTVESILELLAIVCVAAAWLIPNHYPPWSSFYNDSCAATAVVLLVAANLRGLSRSPVPSIAWLAVVLALVPACQWVLGLLDFSGDAIVSALYALGLATAIVVGRAWGARDVGSSAAERLAAATVAGAAASAVLAIATAFGLQFGAWVLDGSSGMRQTANLGQPNNLATLLGWGGLGVMLLYERRRIGALGGSVLVALLVAGVALTQSRTALLYGPAVLLLATWFARRGVRLRTPRWFLLGTSVAVCLAVWIWPSWQEALLLTPTETLAQRSVGSVRFTMWPILLGALSHHPWIGFGWLQVGAAQLAVAGQHAPVGELYMHGHDLFLELALWAGYPLGIALGLSIVAWFVTRLRAVRTLDAAVGIMVITVLGIHSLFELPYHYAYFLLPAGLWMGIVERDCSTPRFAASGWALAPVALAALLLVAVWRDYPSIEDDFRAMRFENLRIATNDREAPRSPEAPFLSSLTAYLDFTRMPSRAGMTPAELAYMDAVVRRYPYAPAMRHEAEALALNGHLDRARSLMIEIRHIHGEGIYYQIVRDLDARIAEGRTELTPLAQSLPPVEPSP